MIFEIKLTIISKNYNWETIDETKQLLTGDFTKIEFSEKSFRLLILVH